MMTRSAALLALLALACAPGESSREEAVGPSACVDVPKWTFDESAIYPPTGTLTRPEDGRALPGGRLVAADEAHGLRIVEDDGTSRAFPGFVELGCRHNPAIRSALTLEGA